MTNLFIIKLALGTTTVLGGSTAATYFGTKTTVEDFIRKENPSLKRKSDWSKPASETEETPKDNVFINIKNDQWKNLESKCKEIYSWTYEALWMKHTNISDNLKEDIQKYCFTS